MRVFTGKPGFKAMRTADSEPSPATLGHRQQMQTIKSKMEGKGCRSKGRGNCIESRWARSIELLEGLLRSAGWTATQGDRFSFCHETYPVIPLMGITEKKEEWHSRMLEIMLVTSPRNIFSPNPASLSPLAEHGSANCLTPAQNGHGCQGIAKGKARLKRGKQRHRSGNDDIIITSSYSAVYLIRFGATDTKAFHTLIY
ncbi:predicted protein [Histoplasma capsulatum G186AR]|uniref:Uncharacterized protein n=1 Tax=Ajellomyces capsulatus (strain G186AR / H82 / ATCC MYA-2454 / RMSCC 2432) TaxID=447093 RepID=C0NFU4_AJECG|nr:uncharacterized protein HCBG_01760 [Histoplasma capsulatum G186AR]EEH10115.1 predicted protein [Histoplasma capsulatum G186AR]